MTNKEILQADLLDILFENRNKAYGAYTLRKNYNHHLTLSLGFTLSIIFGLILFSVSRNKKSQDSITVDRNRDSVTLIDLPKKKVKPIEPPKLHVTIPFRAAQHHISNNIQIVKDSVTNIPTQAQLQTTFIYNTYKTGADPSKGNEPVISTAENKKGEIKSDEKDSPRMVPSEIPPSYPGGLQAFKTYLSRHLVVPEELESGEKKTVVVHFLVDIDGSISRIEIIQSGGNNFDKEVVRVLSKMSKWNAAVQNGHKVAVPFTQPVTFVGIEQ